MLAQAAINILHVFPNPTSVQGAQQFSPGAGSQNPIHLSQLT